ncbi:hypothetical protein DKM44_09590 [Deinococcus irradiatisoli]|uniref:Intracellular proteinase inhibitor BsuPI domain-containing protein n=1 Tax=Deinococcus irradiatisoli TaxID=2202254 RepID=A0A2Z3JHC8_9DEIO|nr:hypothetical protein [Deinococcus irradiatisoli]AWN23446.1 hypothetical protein DKM44_09590 [Deinococcus irradiatisoli]
MNKLLLLVVLGALNLPALAQDTLPEIAPTSQPAPVQDTAAPTDMNAQPASPVLAPVPLDQVSAILGALRTVSGEFTLTLTLKNAQAKALSFSAGRDSDQNCAAAPSVRVLQVGTRAVVYPTGEKRICTQEMKIVTAPAGGSATFERTLNLPAGEYMIEGWFQGFAGDAQQRVKVGAQPIRITVK